MASPSGSPNGEPFTDPQLQAHPKRPCSPSTCTPDVPQAPPSRLSPIRENHQAEGFSEDVTKILLSATCQSTHKTYQSSWGIWCRWCCKRKVNPNSASLSDVLLFPTDRFNNGAAYRSVNVAWSSISSAHPKIDGHPVGQHPLVVQLLRGMLNMRPQKPRYTHIWDVHLVTKCLACSQALRGTGVGDREREPARRLSSIWPTSDGPSY